MRRRLVPKSAHIVRWENGKKVVELGEADTTWLGTVVAVYGLVAVHMFPVQSISVNLAVELKYFFCLIYSEEINEHGAS